VAEKSFFEWLMVDQCRSLSPIGSLFDPNRPDIRCHFLLIWRFGRAWHRSNEVVLEEEGFSEVRIAPVQRLIVSGKLWVE
jgi:hypothetical protein